MNKTDIYKQQLSQSEDWIRFLYDHSKLPGPRANLELLQAVVELGDESFFNRCLEYDEKSAPTNTPGEFIAACAAAGLGKLVCNGQHAYYKILRELASDSRWRVREGVAFALQRIGKHDFKDLVKHLDPWMHGSPYEKRAVVAGLCEPYLLRDTKQADQVLGILISIMESIAGIQDRSSDPFIALKKGLGYGFSVVIVAIPDKGKEAFGNLLSNKDRDIRWILKENLKKKRLVRMDPDWIDGVMFR